MNLQELVQSVKGLPSAPRVLVRLLKVVNNPDADSSQVIEVLNLDPALTAEVIRLANSAYFSSSPASTLEESVARLGYLEVYRLAARIPAGEMFSGAIEPMGIAAGELWEHSVACAIIADELGERCSVADGTAYTAGLLHDVGKLILREARGADYARVFELIESEQVTLNEAERKLFGFDHAEAGGALLEHWNFPAELHNAVRFQYEPAKSPEPRSLAAILLLSNWVAAALGANHGRDVWAMNIGEDVREIVDLQADDLDRLLCSASARLRKAAQLLAAGHAPAVC
jgi:putative nucleotidyltransferase with HDIG domain